MRVFKCVKTDFRVTKNMSWFYLLFFAIVIAVTCFSREDISVFWGFMYMQFAGLVCATMPFFTGGGFLANLPVRQEERVCGRYLYGTLLMLLTAIVGGITMALRALIRGDVVLDDSTWPVIAVLLGIALVFMAAQFLIMYLFDIKNMQVLSLLRMVPAFVFFFGANGIAEEIETGTGGAPAVIAWGLEHPEAASLAVLGIGCLAVVVCAVISCVRERGRY